MSLRHNKTLLISILIALVLLPLGGIWWGYAHLTALVQKRLSSVLGEDVTVGEVTARWNRVELARVRIPRRGPGPFDSRVAVDRVVIRPRLLSLFSGRLEIDGIVLEKPYILVEIRPDGSHAPIIRPRSTQPNTSGSAAMPIRIASLRIEKGRLDLLDWHIARTGGLGLSNPREHFHLLRVDDVALKTGELDLPLTAQPTALDVSASGAGGRLTAAGKVALKGLDSSLKIGVSGLDISRFRPYYLRKGDLGVASGRLSADCTLTIRQRHLNAPGTLHLKGLTFDGSGAKGALLGMPARALVAFLSDNHDTLSVAFSLDGSLDNPHFSLHQSLVDQVATALSSKIGVPSLGSIGRGVMSIFGIKRH